MDIIIAALLALIILLLIAVLLRSGNKNEKEITFGLSLISQKLDKQDADKLSSDKLLREELANSLERSRLSTKESVDSGLMEIRAVLDEKLNVIRGTVDEKLTKNLNDRLDSNFRQISERLGELYKTLGDLNRLSGGVEDLNRTISNVKARGVWGEQQLEAILRETMTENQYAKNVITKRGSADRVEFAVKLPVSGEQRSTYLPIDSKFPSDIYSRLYEASEKCDPKGVSEASKELEQRIKKEAATISSKYIDPPSTTDFAIMFLPTEGLYAEVLRIPGLSQWCQSQQRIMIAGPTTITALLNSLRVGFTNVALNEKSIEVMKILSAMKTQYRKFDETIDTVKQRLELASRSADELKHRSEIIGKKMSSIEELDIKESHSILGISDDNS